MNRKRRHPQHDDDEFSSLEKVVYKNHQVVVVAGRYMLYNRLGKGSFGQIFSCFDQRSGRKHAMKLERLDCRHPQLEHEARVLQRLQEAHSMTSSSMSFRFPRVEWTGLSGDYRVLVEERLGPTLEDLFEFCGRRFSLKTTLMLLDQMLAVIHFVHSHAHVVHRDLKPDNFLMGRREHAHRLYTIDFGLSKPFLIPSSSSSSTSPTPIPTFPPSPSSPSRPFVHIPYREGKRGITGTARYCSLNAHLGIECSRRDDLESIGFISVYFLKGSLPWMGIWRLRDKVARLAAIKRRKQCIPISDLCVDLPEEFIRFFRYVRALEFEEEPDYVALRQMMRRLFQKKGYSNDCVYDWTARAAEEMEREERERDREGQELVQEQEQDMMDLEQHSSSSGSGGTERRDASGGGGGNDDDDDGWMMSELGNGGDVEGGGDGSL